MAATPSQSELFDACTVLFGPGITISVDFLKYLRPSGVKAAYRKRARETHPDMSQSLGMDETLLNERFKAVTLAYELLNTVVKENGAVLTGTMKSDIWPSARPKPKPSPKKPPTGGYSEKKGFSDHFYDGFIPRRELRIGQYLYYSGIITWSMLIDSILWQRRNRPLIGQIARDWKILTGEDIHKILMARKTGEKFGECAIRECFITPFNLLALLGKQRKLQQRIGEYFVRQDILCSQEIETMVEKLKIHNRKAFWRDW